jgi:hypothetical protein
VIERHLRLGEGDWETVANAVPDDRDAELAAVRLELYELLHQRLSWSFKGGEAERYTKLACRKSSLLGPTSDAPKRPISR